MSGAGRDATTPGRGTVRSRVQPVILPERSISSPAHDGGIAPGHVRDAPQRRDRPGARRRRRAGGARCPVGVVARRPRPCESRSGGPPQQTSAADIGGRHRQTSEGSAMMISPRIRTRGSASGTARTGLDACAPACWSSWRSSPAPPAAGRRGARPRSGLAARAATGARYPCETPLLRHPPPPAHRPPSTRPAPRGVPRDHPRSGGPDPRGRAQAGEKASRVRPRAHPGGLHDARAR